LKENPKKHKFKFEGIVFDPKLHPNKDSKALFDHYISSQLKVEGNAIRREVVFNFLNTTNYFTSPQENIPNVSNSAVNLPPSPQKNIDNKIYPDLSENLPKAEAYVNQSIYLDSSKMAFNLQNKEEGPFQQNVNLDSGIQNSNLNSNQNFTKPPPNKELEKQLQEMKIEFYKYKHQLSNLTETYKNMKSRADIEKKGPENNLIAGASCKKYILIIFS